MGNAISNCFNLGDKLNFPANLNCLNKPVESKKCNDKLNAKDTVEVK